MKNFVSKAPANVIDMERKKQADAESKIASLKESIAALKNKKLYRFTEIATFYVKRSSLLF